MKRRSWSSLLALVALACVLLAPRARAYEVADLDPPADTPDAQAETSPPAVPFAQSYTRDAVAADDARASAVGAQILADGGNAADAAAATMLALGVVNPASSGLGGGGFALYYRASDHSLTFLDFRERAPAASTSDMFEDAAPGGEGPLNTASQLGGLAVGVPGEPAGVAELARRFGRLPLARVVAPAAHLADGFEASDQLTEALSAWQEQLARDPGMRRWYGTSGALAHIERPDLARTLREFGRRGPRAIYGGRVGRAIVQRVRESGGIMTMQDLADYSVVEREPLRADHLGFTWVTAPPPSAGGYTMLESLDVLERIPARWRGAPSTPPDVHWLHALAESWKGPFLDRQRYFGDPDQVALPLAALMNPERAAVRAATFHPTLALPPLWYEQALPDAPRVAPSEDHGTSHLCVVDAEGNVAAVTTTVNLVFGARISAAGIVLNDEMDDFASAVGEANAFGLPGGAANLPAPGKRPVSTMSPTIVFQNGEPVLCIGAAGGSRIVTATEQVAVNALMRSGRISDAMAAPRIHHQGLPDILYSEEFAPLPLDVLATLVARGHRMETMGHVAAVQAIRMRRVDGAVVLDAASDPRKGGRSAGADR